MALKRIGGISGYSQTEFDDYITTASNVQKILNSPMYLGSVVSSWPALDSIFADSTARGEFFGDSSGVQSMYYNETALEKIKSDSNGMTGVANSTTAMNSMVSDLDIMQEIFMSEHVVNTIWDNSNSDIILNEIYNPALPYTWRSTSNPVESYIGSNDRNGHGLHISVSHRSGGGIDGDDPFHSFDINLTGMAKLKFDLAIEGVSGQYFGDATIKINGNTERSRETYESQNAWSTETIDVSDINGIATVEFGSKIRAGSALDTIDEYISKFSNIRLEKY